jgi:hypothetical protein
MKVTPSDQILAQDIENEIVLLNTQTGRYFGLVSNGQRIWQLLTELGDTEMAIEALRLEYDVDEATLRQDVGDLVEKLLETGLITVSETPA